MDGVQHKWMVCSTKMDGVQHKWMVCSINGWCAAQMDGVQHKWMVCSTNGWCAANIKARSPPPIGTTLYYGNLVTPSPSSKYSNLQIFNRIVIFKEGNS